MDTEAYPCVVWLSLAGCPEAALGNIYGAVKAASSQGALGAVVCDWTGKGHLTHQPFAWPGFLMGAGLAWNTECHRVSVQSDRQRSPDVSSLMGRGLPGTQSVTG